MEGNKKVFDKIALVLNYVGLIGAITMALGYIIVIFVLIKGFEAHDILQTTIFSIVTAAVGFIIMTFMKVQGQAWAESIEENKEVVKEYKGPKVKHKKLRSMNHFWVTSTIKDILFKIISVGGSSIGIIYIVITGSNDWSLMLLGIFNLLLFICFGMLACSKSYNFYNNEYIPYLKEKIYEGKVKAETQGLLDDGKERDTDKGNDTVVSNSNGNILESDLGRIPAILPEYPMGMDNGNDLDGSLHTSDSDS